MSRLQECATAFPFRITHWPERQEHALWTNVIAPIQFILSQERVAVLAHPRLEPSLRVLQVSAVHPDGESIAFRGTTTQRKVWVLLFTSIVRPNTEPSLQWTFGHVQLYPCANTHSAAVIVVNTAGTNTIEVLLQAET